MARSTCGTSPEIYTPPRRRYCPPRPLPHRPPRRTPGPGGVRQHPRGDRPRSAALVNAAAAVNWADRPPPSSGAPSPSAAGPLSRHSSCRADPLCPPQRAVAAHELPEGGGCVARPRRAGPSVGICRGTQGGQCREPAYRQQALRALGPSAADLGGPSRATQTLSSRLCRQTPMEIALCVSS